MTAKAGHNSVEADKLRSLVERIELLLDERKAIGDDVRDVFSEAKTQGYDTKTMRMIIKLRNMEKSGRDEMDMLLTTYRAALDME